MSPIIRRSQETTTFVTAEEERETDGAVGQDIVSEMFDNNNWPPMDAPVIPVDPPQPQPQDAAAVILTQSLPDVNIERERPRPFMKRMTLRRSKKQ